MFEKPKSFDNLSHLRIPWAWQVAMQEVTRGQLDMEGCRMHTIRNNASMFYSIMKCNELKNDYVASNGLPDYDVVIRCRFDLEITSPLYMQQFDMNYIHYHDMKQPDDIISDWFNFGNTHVMNVYASTFPNFEALNALKEGERLPVSFRGDPNCFWGNEQFLREIMRLNGVQKRGVRIPLQLRYD